MIYLTIDGDDVGQRITRFYLNNDEKSLANLNDLMGKTTQLISTYLKSIGFTVIFCGADGVAGFAQYLKVPGSNIFKEISALGEGCATFSVGVGCTLRESYIALMSAKSAGKAQLHNYKDLIG